MIRLMGDFDRKHGVVIVKGKGSKERRIALGTNCLRNLLYYLDRHRPDEAELAEGVVPGRIISFDRLGVSDLYCCTRANLGLLQCCLDDAPCIGARFRPQERRLRQGYQWYLAQPCPGVPWRNNQEQFI